MISVISNAFEANRINDVSVHRASTSAVASRVSMDIKQDSRVLNEAARVREMKDEEGEEVDKSPVKSGRVKAEGKKVKSEHRKSSEYDLMLSSFDEFAGNVKNWSVGYGFEMGDMVWGKVKSHPWWPGHIFSEAFATPSVRRSKREGHILVAFYGDSSYGWFDPDELVHFEPTFAEKSVQTNVKNFVKAVEEAVDEVGRRSALGLVCHCRRKRYDLRPADVNGFFSVDFSDYEKNCTYSASQIKKARERFQPKETFDFMKKLALKPRSDLREDLEFVKKRATVLAYRKAVFEENDPTYAEAFGVIPSKQTQEAAKPFRQPSARAPLSGRLVLAETLGKGKSSAKSNKTKDQVEKDRYLFKRRDEPGNLKVHQVGAAQAGSSDQPVHLDGSSLAGKDLSSGAADHLPSESVSTLIESSKQPSSQAANVEELQGQIQTEDGATNVQPSVPSEPSRVNINSGSDKVKDRKRSGEEVSGGNNPSTERKKKKKKKAALGLNANFNHVEGQAGVSSDNLVMEKVAKESVQIPSASREELQVDIQQKGDAIDSSVPDPVLIEDEVEIRSNNIELPKVLSDLHALALDPFYGAEGSNVKTIRELFLKFRSLVYQKSLTLSAVVESESSTPVNKSPVAAPTSDTAPTNNVKQTSNLKPQKNPARPDDPTKGGRKRGPSDRQEEIAVKKKKKMNDLRALAAEKKACLKASEVQQGESKEMPVKKLAPTPVRVSKQDIGKKKGPVEKVPDPTLLIMKFPPNGALPSIPELKARFARFGTLDHSATRVFWKSSTCRLLYQYKEHAEEAYKFAASCNNLFGNANVRCFIREVAAETQETETTKASREDGTGTSAQKDGAADPRSSAKPGQLKSCLKKPPGEEGPSTNGGNGSNRVPRVKFLLGEDKNRAEQTNDSKNVNNSNSIVDRSASSSSNVNNYTTQLSMPPLPTAQYGNTPNDAHFTHQVAHRNVPNYNNQVPVPEVDIAQPMLGLLTRCNDIVTNITGLLGYVPYHPL